MKEVSLQTLLEAGCHFGHQTVRWNPKMRPYIYAAREGVHIFDLAKTKEGLEVAVAYVQTIIAEGGKILFVGTKRQAREVIEKTAKEVGMPYVNQRWLGGTITNFDQIKKSIEKLHEMKRKRTAGEYKSFTKREQLLIDREILKLERFLGGLAGVTEQPTALFIIDVKREMSAAKEAQRRGVKVVAMVDTNADPDLVDYVIPTNDDAAGAIELIASVIGNAVNEGLKMAKVKKDKEDKKKADDEEKAHKLEIKEELKEEALAIEQNLVEK